VASCVLSRQQDQRRLLLAVSGLPEAGRNKHAVLFIMFSRCYERCLLTFASTRMISFPAAIPALRTWPLRSLTQSCYSRVVPGPGRLMASTKNISCISCATCGTMKAWGFI
jgi:hypothetical protein